jgi:alpha-amylase
MNRVSLILALHNHQPVGNFDWVVDAAMEKAYLPFLDVIDRFGEIPFCLHVSGCLLDWAERKKPAYVEALRKAVRSGRTELLGGGRFEPIFTSLPERDRIGQIRSLSDHLEALFGVRPRGMWLPERVFEQSLVSSLARADMAYTVVDDYHILRGGGRDLYGHFLTEDQGKRLYLFPSSETLRYQIPFAPAEKVIETLRGIAEARDGALVVYADDGEKFGVWPGTYSHVYENGWLETFLGLLRENADWIECLTFSQALERRPDPRLFFLPDSSYREMVEWALPVDVLSEFRRLEEDLRSAGLLERFRPFAGGGFWRNFRVKYPEANRLYSRMMEVSEEVARLPRHAPGREEARLSLYRGQVNCVYWHGVFGGLYLPHLRMAAYRHLLDAENRVRAARHEDPGTVRTRVFDFDFDGQSEVSVENGFIKAYVAPHRGGRLFELDLLPKQFNLMMTMTRRREDYHAQIPKHETTEEVLSIHDIRRSKVEGIREKIVYDAGTRASLVDHFFGPDLTLGTLARATAEEAGDFVKAPYSLDISSSAQRAELNLFRCGTVRKESREVELSLVKKISVAADGPGLGVDYALRCAEDLEVAFGAEFNFAMLSGEGPDRGYIGPDGERIGPLGLETVLGSCRGIELVDEWMKLRVALEFSDPAELYLYPVETVSQSESGFELLYQQSCVTPVWHLKLEAGQMRELSVRLGLSWEGGFPQD